MNPPGKGEPSRVKHPQLTQHRPIGALDGCAPHPAGSVLVVQDVQVNPTKDPLHHWVLGPPYDIPVSGEWGLSLGARSRTCLNSS